MASKRGTGKRKAGAGKISVTVREIPGKARTASVARGAAISDLLSSLRINRERVVVRKNGRLLPESEALSNGDVVEVVSIISGG